MRESCSLWAKWAKAIALTAISSLLSCKQETAPVAMHGELASKVVQDTLHKVWGKTTTQSTATHCANGAGEEIYGHILHVRD